MEDKLIEQFLEEIETILYLEYTLNDKNIAERLLYILEKEYDI